MMTSKRHCPRPLTHSGFVLPMVIFLIVILASAAVAISQLTADNTASGIQALQKTRAQYFSQSGLDWAVYQILLEEYDPEKDDSENAGACNTDPDTENFVTHTDFPGLELDVKCTPNEYSGFVLWDLEAVVRSINLNPNDEEYVWYRMTAAVELPIP